jgi:hypothetical protein
MLILAGWTGLSVGFVLGALWARVMPGGRRGAEGRRRDRRIPPAMVEWWIPTESSTSTAWMSTTRRRRPGVTSVGTA